jgi:hypothetical protein
MQSEHHQPGFMESAAGQTTLLIGAAVLLLAFAWLFIV